jgi:predicted ATP-grasp superfamily ATP-dependent carboligase
MKPRVLVTDGEQRAALAIVRSLGKQGYTVTVSSRDGHSLAGASRFARGDEPTPDPQIDEHGFLTVLADICVRRQIDALIPTTDLSNVVILPTRDRFSGVRVLAPSVESFLRISDKEAVQAAARDAGIWVPRGLHLKRPQSNADLGVPPEMFPVVVKPSRSVGGHAGRRVRTGVAYASSPRELEERVGSLPEEAYPVLIQQRIHGPGVGVFLLRWEGKTLAAFAHRRIREKPPSGGVSVYRESVPVPTGLLPACETLLDAHDWRGVAMVEFKVCERTDTPYLMEVNGRFWGSLQLAIDAGVDFPVLLLAAEFGEPDEPVTEYKIGTRCRWWWGDLDHFVALWKESRRAGDTGDARPSVHRALGRLLRIPRSGDRLEVLRMQDPFPFLRESIDWFAAALRR